MLLPLDELLSSSDSSDPSELWPPPPPPPPPPWPEPLLGDGVPQSEGGWEESLLPDERKSWSESSSGALLGFPERENPGELLDPATAVDSEAWAVLLELIFLQLEEVVVVLRDWAPPVSAQGP